MSVINKLKTLASDSVIYGLGNAMSKFITIFLVPVYTAIFTPTDYGVLSIVNNTFWLITILLVFSLDNSTARWFYDTEDKEERRQIVSTWFWFYLLASVVFGIALFMGSGLLSSLLFQSDKATDYFKLQSVALPFVAIFTVASNILRFERRPYSSILLTCIQSISIVGLNILFIVKLRSGLIGIYYSLLISNVLAFLIGGFFLRKWITRPQIRKKLLYEMISYSLPFIPATIGYWVINLSGTFFINHFRGGAEAGLFQVGATFASGVAIITTAFQQALSPFVFSIINHADAKETYAKILMTYAMGMLSVIILFAAFSREVLMIFTSHGYYDAASVVIILIYSQFFMGMGYIANIGASIARKTKPLGFIMTVTAVLYPLLSLLLVPWLGKDGAALTTCVSQVIVAVYMFYRSQKTYYIPYDFGYIAQLFAVSVGILCIIYNVSWIENSILMRIIFVSIFFLVILRKIRSLNLIGKILGK